MKDISATARILIDERDQARATLTEIQELQAYERNAWNREMDETREKRDRARTELVAMDEAMKALLGEKRLAQKQMDDLREKNAHLWNTVNALSRTPPRLMDILGKLDEARKRVATLEVNVSTHQSVAKHAREDMITLEQQVNAALDRAGILEHERDAALKRVVELETSAKASLHTNEQFRKDNRGLIGDLNAALDQRNEIAGAIEKVARRIEEMKAGR